LTIKHDAKIESFFRMKSTGKQEHNLNFKRNSYIPKMCVDPCPVGSTTRPKPAVKCPQHLGREGYRKITCFRILVLHEVFAMVICVNCDYMCEE